MEKSEAHEHFAKLSAELAHWSKHGQIARFFLRDDDAIEITPDLIHLQKMTATRNIPILLAVIPNFAKCELGKFVKSHPQITPAVHGFSHENHAGKGEKKTELGAHRPVDQVLRELNDARLKMIGLFGHHLSDILVPPWNRIDGYVAAGAKGLGFRAISGFGWKNPNNDISWINTHVDIINWRKNASAKSIAEVTDELTANLQIARNKAFAPVGILSHHLVHNQLCWHILDELLEYLCNQKNVKWVNADDLIVNIDP
ncbi:MAG: polysaccharide deacetylase [Hyphomicrobiales bacterium]|nr:polysaccharide deacetylase [Hyphomicrobiales bacterium]